MKLPTRRNILIPVPPPRAVLSTAAKGFTFKISSFKLRTRPADDLFIVSGAPKGHEGLQRYIQFVRRFMVFFLSNQWGRGGFETSLQDQVREERVEDFVDISSKYPKTGSPIGALFRNPLYHAHFKTGMPFAPHWALNGDESTEARCLTQGQNPHSPWRELRALFPATGCVERGLCGRI